MTKRTKKYKCNTCSLDCAVTRSRNIEAVPECKRDEFIKKVFGDTKAKYDVTSCPKR